MGFIWQWKTVTINQGESSEAYTAQMAGRPDKLPHKLLSLHELSTRGNIQAVLSGLHWKWSDSSTYSLRDKVRVGYER